MLLSPVRALLVNHSSSQLRLGFFFCVVFPLLFDKRPPYILEHLINLVGGEFVVLALGTRANPLAGALDGRGQRRVGAE